ncbi:hypothetical protein [Phocaeicola barnesiae]|uniref:Fimbrillin family protein n=1 Tax=Phocaeicola barnesiae TaxID=376804 RepID=A0AAW5N968_9BACT|nr:hypothetical protein [Phocaeicola barnesiae]MCR8875092.1 hypothetical protein [Phocaeicola barnesiae]
MKKTVICYMTLAALLAVGCTKEEMPTATEGAALQVEVRSGTAGTHDVRLFLANRSKEHNNDELHCPKEWRFDLKESAESVGSYTYSLVDMLPQWYKMTFVAVPHIEGATFFSEEIPDDNTCDFNKLVIDYSPALQYGINGRSGSTADLAIYRSAADGWLEKGKTLTKDVTLDRLTGMLVLNMGVLKDQFEKQVTSIVLQMRVPTRMYVSDEGYGNLVLTDEETVSYTYPITEEEWKSNEDYTITNVHLLPGVLTEAYLGVICGDKDNPIVYPIATTTPQAETVEIKSNMRTLLNFNGMKDTEFEIRYAGFDTGDNDAVIGIEDNDWTAGGSTSEDGVYWPEDSGLGIEDEWTDGGSVSDDGVDWPEDTGNPGT